MAAVRFKSLPLRIHNFMIKKSDPSTRFFGLPPIIRSIHSKGFNPSVSSDKHTTEEVKDMFEAWMIKHKKAYDTPAEKEKRFQIFRDNLKEIEKHNSTGNPSYTLELAQFTDITLEEFRRMYGHWRTL